MPAKPQGANIEFAFYRSAIDDPGTPRSVFTAVGRAAMAWARLETHLDAIILHINKKDHSEELYGEHPVSFSNKLKVAKRWFNKHPALLPHKNAMQALTQAFKVLSQQARNPLLHSIFSAYDAQKKELTLQSIYYTGNDSFRLREEKMTLEAVHALYKDVQLSNEFLGIISRQLFSPDGVKRFDKPE